MLKRQTAHETLPPSAHVRLVSALRLRYQPIIRLAGMRTESVEVLARAEAADGAINGPESIVDAMTGEIESMSLTGAILRHALAELKNCGLGHSSLPFAVNLPLDAMLHPNLIGIIAAIRGNNPQKICFELTERHPVRDVVQVAAVIATLRHAGYLLALDDVTPQTPNLAALLKLPLHAIKLDRSIVNDNTAANRAFIRDITAQAQANNQPVIAEGIETVDTLSHMRDLNVSHGQGFLFAHPLPASELLTYLGG